MGLVVALLASSALFAPGLAFAQTPAAAPGQPPEPPQQIAPPAPQGALVNRIVVRGNERIEDSTVVSYLPIQVGTVVTEAQLDEAISLLNQSGLFGPVTLEVEGTDLIVTVVENPIINRVIFEGEKALKEDKLSDEVQARPRGIFTPARVQQDVARLLEVYRRAGRISANVTPKIVELPQKRVDLIFEIDEGPKSGILDINFLGNVQFSDSDLRGVITTERSAFYKFLSTNTNYDPDRVEYDESQLREHYRNKGFYDFRVVSSIAELRPDKNGFALTYTLDEGKVYRFGNVTVQTELNRLDGRALELVLQGVLPPGEIYQDTRMEAARDALVYSAGAVGFAFVDIDERAVPNPETGLVDVTFTVTEGPRVYVERIDVVGNTQTLDKVIRREMRLVEGDAFNQALLDQSEQAIRALQFFKEPEGVAIEQLPGTAPDKTVLRVAVQEQPTGQLAFSAGYSSIDQLVLDFSIEQRNFRGRGQDLRVIARTGAFQQNINLSFTEPKFMGRNLGAGFDLYSYRYDFEEEAGYTINKTGGNLRMGFPLSLQSYLQLVYSLTNDDVTVSNLTCNLVTRPALCSQVGAKITSLAAVNWSMDKTNDRRQPSRGYRLSVNQSFAGIGGDISYIKSEFDASWYYPFNADFVFSAAAQSGFIAGLGGDTVRVNDRFFKGGQTFRGFETAGIGPRDISFNNALGGKIFGIASLELTVPSFLPENFPVKAALFTDFGTLGGIDDIDKVVCTTVSPPVCRINPAVKDDFSLRASAGISIGWRSPLGPIQFDISKVLAKEPYDRTETFRFSTSTRF